MATRSVTSQIVTKSKYWSGILIKSFTIFDQRLFYEKMYKLLPDFLHYTVPVGIKTNR